MNKTNYKQYDTRWNKLPYRYSPDNIGNNGCGEVSVCNAIIEMASQMHQTPKTMQPYCKQYACSDGTYWSAIPTMLEHYGCTEVKQHGTMNSLWKELKKGNRVAVYMMNNRPAGSKGIHWTSGGHFICSVDYKYKGGEHWVYVKDSNSISESRNGWMTYSGSLRGDVSAVWTGKLNGKPAPSPKPIGKLVVDGVGGTATVTRIQEYFDLSDPDGLIGGQNASQKKYRPAMTAVANGKGRSQTVTALQRWCGLDPDGIWGKNTSNGLQKKLKALGYYNGKMDGIFGAESVKALQTYLNDQLK